MNRINAIEKAIERNKKEIRVFIKTLHELKKESLRLREKIDEIHFLASQCRLADGLEWHDEDGNVLEFSRQSKYHEYYDICESEFKEFLTEVGEMLVYRGYDIVFYENNTYSFNCPACIAEQAYNKTRIEFANFIMKLVDPDFDHNFINDLIIDKMFSLVKSLMRMENYDI